MRRMSVERRLLLKTAASAAFGLVNGATLADILQPDSSADAKNRGREDLSVAQLRLGEDLIRHIADRGKAGAGGNLIVSPASVASSLSFVDLGASNPMRAAIHQALGF